jgi:hypothetical protein
MGVPFIRGSGNAKKPRLFSQYIAAGLMNPE